MTGFLNWREYFARVMPTSLRRHYGTRMTGMLALMQDAIGTGIVEAQRATWTQEETSPDDILPLVGRERRLFQYPGETEASFRQRIWHAWETWARAGNEQAIIDELEAMNLGGIEIKSYRTPGWDWDSAAGFTWQEGVGGAANWSRFWVVIKNHPWTATNTWGDAGQWGDGGIRGLSATRAEAEAVVAIVNKYRPAHVTCAWVILVTDPGTWENEQPNGTWYDWRNRSRAARYFDCGTNKPVDVPTGLSTEALQAIVGASAVEADLDSRYGVTTVSGAVSQWTCQATGRTFSQATPAKRLIYNPSDSNWDGLPSLTGDAANKWLDSDDPASDWKFLHDGSDAYVLAVVRLGTVASGFPRIIGTGDGAGNIGLFMFYNDPAGSLNVTIGNGTGTAYTLVFGAASENANYALSCTLQATSPYLELYKNGIKVHEDTTEVGSASSSDPQGPLRIGSAIGGGNGWVGEILRIIILSVRPSGAQRSQIETLLRQTYPIP